MGQQVSQTVKDWSGVITVSSLGAVGLGAYSIYRYRGRRRANRNPNHPPPNGRRLNMPVALVPHQGLDVELAIVQPHQGQPPPAYAAVDNLPLPPAYDGHNIQPVAVVPLPPAYLDGIH